MRNWREPISDHLAPKMEFSGQNRFEIEHLFSLRGSLSDQCTVIRIFLNMKKDALIRGFEKDPRVCAPQLAV